VIEGCWCPYCSNKKLCEKLDCPICHEKSFASHEKSIYWSSKNILSPRNVFRNSGKKFRFECKECKYEFETTCNSITNSNTWCPKCVNKTEKKLFDYLVSIYPDVKHQYKVDWCMKIRHLPFDFCIEKLRIIIELDGPQHYIQISNWRNPEEQQEIDRYKEKCANKNGFSVIRILQEEIWFDSIDWKKELEIEIEKITKENIIQNVNIHKI